MLTKNTVDGKHRFFSSIWIVSLLLTVLMITMTALDVFSATTLNWTAPTTNTDGTALTDLAGYKIYYGT